MSCGSRRPKRELYRVVRTPEGKVVYDPTGKENGRGAYLCGEDACLTAGAVRKLGRALDAPVPEEVLSIVRSRRDGTA